LLNWVFIYYYPGVKRKRETALHASKADQGCKFRCVKPPKYQTLREALPARTSDTELLGQTLAGAHDNDLPAPMSSEGEALAAAEAGEPGFQPRRFETRRPGRRLVSAGAAASAAVEQLSRDQAAVSPQTPILPRSLRYLIIKKKSNNIEFYFIHYKTVKLTCFLCYFKLTGSLQKSLAFSFNRNLICCKKETSFDI